MMRHAIAITVAICYGFFLSAVPVHALFLQAGPKRTQQDSTASGSETKHDLSEPLASHGSHTSQLKRILSQGLNTSKLFDAPVPLVSVGAPNMFVAVMTKRDTPVVNRNALRELWHGVNGGSGNVCVRFSVCKANDTHQQSLVAEQTAYGDLLFLDCEEGYGHGLLTKKVIASMQAFHDAGKKQRADAWCLDRELFFKVDDDTYVASHRFRLGLSAARAQFGTGAYIYAGVYSAPAPVVREKKSKWFEPFNLWPLETYPAAMYGGSGYILGKALVQRIIDDQVAQTNILWNEDRAVGVWVDALQKGRMRVDWIRMPGSNGFVWDYPIKWGEWGAYPYALHHRVSPAGIQCLAMLDRANTPKVSIHQCFQLDPLPDDWTKSWNSKNGKLLNGKDGKSKKEKKVKL